VVLLTNWNWPYAVRGAGSAIFVHRWRAPGRRTAGCVAFAPDDLIWIAKRIRHHTRLIVRA
jgi:L,D-peptidoglycan transpeptidase YkuD (ErfK/YbiS/YcfS/YnhG family)